jgi:hypothetical protein
MKALRTCWPLCLAIAPMMIGSISRSEVIPHGTTSDLDAAGRLAGNTIPEGSRAICPGVPDGVPLIANLRSGWAIAQSSSQAIRLLFSDQILACEDRSEDADIMSFARKNCSTAWSFSFLLPPECQQVGVFDLSTYEADYRESIAVGLPSGPNEGCSAVSDTCSVAGSGMGAAGGGMGPSATVEIYAVTDQCITGRIQNLVPGITAPPPPDWTGAFHAVRCVPASP